MIGNIIWRLFLFVAVVLILRSAYFVILDAIAVGESATWQSTQGTVVRFTDVNGEGVPRTWKRDRIVEYSYRVNGDELMGNQISFSRRSRWTFDDVKKATAQWSADPVLTVYYDEQNPSKSVIQPGGSNLANILFLSIQLIAAVGMSILLVYHIRTNNSKNQAL